jgi:hypothetical protein
MAEKRSPVAGWLVKVPGAAAAAKCSVSMVSVVAEQAFPLTKIPLRHSTKIVCGPGKIVPVRSAPAGFRTV